MSFIETIKSWFKKRSESSNVEEYGSEEKSCEDVDAQAKAQVEQEQIEKATVELVTGDELVK